MTIKLIILDNYGVILHGGYPQTMKFLAKKYKRDWIELHKIFYTKYFNMAAERKITQTVAWKMAVEETKIPMRWQDVRKLHYSFMGINKDVARLLPKMRKLAKVVLVSKNTRSQFSDVDKFLHFKGHFDGVINTYELNLPKASKETMIYIFKRFNVRPKEVIFVDDQEDNLDAARMLGVHVFLYTGLSKFKKDIFSRLG